MPHLTQTLDEEQASFDATVKSIEEWWKSPRQSHIKRPYSATRIASLRSTLPSKYNSNVMALKLWAQLNTHRKNNTTELTFGVTDPIVASQMAKYQQTSMCRVVDKIFRSQQWHDQRQNHFRMLHSKKEREALEHWDYLTPIVADADMGFGGLTSTVKMTKLFVESGVAMFHLDDLSVGKKKFTTGQGRTVVPFGEYLDRLTAARMQIDIMGAETMLLCRCDVDHSEFISDVVDPRDHEYVQGATVEIKSLQDSLKEAAEAGMPILEVRKEWLKRAGICTYDEAVKARCTDAEYSAYLAEIGTGVVSLRDRRAAAKKTVCKPILFDWDLSRSRDGQFLYKSCVKAIVERATAAAPLGDVTWARMDAPNWADIVSFHEQMRKVYPERLFAFGYTGDFDFPKAGFSADALRTLPADMAKMGVVWQVQPIWGLQGLNFETEKFAKLWRERGIEGYVNEVQKPALATEPKTDGFEKGSYCGSYLADAFFDTIAIRDLGEGPKY